MTLLPVRVPAGDKAAVGTVRPGDGAVGVDLPGVTAGAVGKAPVFEYASTVAAGFGLPPGPVGGSGVAAVSVGDPVPGQYWPCGQNDQG